MTILATIERVQRGLKALQKGLEQTQRAVESIRVRAQGIAVRGVISRVDDSKKVQRIQVDLLADETEDDVEHFMPYGFNWVVPTGAEALVFAVGADRAHSIALAAQVPGKRPKGGKPNTGGLYTDGKYHVFVDASKMTHIGEETGKEPFAMHDTLKKQLDDIRKRIDDINTAFFQYATTHTHIVATAMGPATAAPVTPPPTPITPPLGPHPDFSTKKCKGS